MVPFDTNLKFSIHSRHLVLGNAARNALPSNADQQAFQHAAKGATPLGFSYSILAAKP